MQEDNFISEEEQSSDQEAAQEVSQSPYSEDIYDDETPAEESRDKEAPAPEDGEEKAAQPEKSEKTEEGPKKEDAPKDEKQDSVQELVRGAHERFREASQIEQRAINVVQEVFKNPIRAYELPAARQLGYTRADAIKAAEQLLLEVLAEEKMTPVEREALRTKQEYERRLEEDREGRARAESEAAEEAKRQKYTALKNSIDAEFGKRGYPASESLLLLIGMRYSDAEDAGYDLPADVAVGQVIDEISKAHWEHLEKLDDAELKKAVPAGIYRRLKYLDVGKNQSPQTPGKTLAASAQDLKSYYDQFRWDPKLRKMVKK